jgi:hypothetical protein
MAIEVLKVANQLNTLSCGVEKTVIPRSNRH